MRVYVPYNDVKLSVTCLGEADFAIQRNNALTILETIVGSAKGWQWHPGVTMWIGQETLLASFAYCINAEWATVSSADHDIKGLPDAYDKKLKMMGFFGHSNPTLPWWWGHDKFHASNRAAMLRHDPEWYGQIFPEDDNEICDWWPRQDKNTWVYGPHPSPDGKFDYIVDGRPVFAESRKMDGEEFARHANTYHNLMPDIKDPIKPSNTGMSALKALHDRFHQKQVYESHDHQ